MKEFLDISAAILGIISLIIAVFCYHQDKVDHATYWLGFAILMTIHVKL